MHSGSGRLQAKEIPSLRLFSEALLAFAPPLPHPEESLKSAVPLENSPSPESLWEIWTLHSQLPQIPRSAFRENTDPVPEGPAGMLG